MNIVNDIPSITRFEEGQRDACSGDSGGPLVAFRADKRAEVQ